LKIINDRRGISPVVTTVIIVAVGITIAIAVALWMTGLIGAFLAYEKIEIRSSYVTVSGSNFVVHITCTNTGSTPTTIDKIFINNVPSSDLTGVTVAPSGKISAPVGTDISLTITIPDGTTYDSNKLTGGVTVTIKLHTTGNKEYFTSVVLP